MLILIPVLGALGLFLEMATVVDRGSPALAQQWAGELSSVSGPDDARVAADATIHSLIFTNGEWVVGRCRNSHGFFHGGGGTLVVHDSEGNTRAFFGHICGETELGGSLVASGEDADLDAFFAKLSELQFTEHDLQP